MHGRNRKACKAITGAVTLDLAQSNIGVGDIEPVKVLAAAYLVSVAGVILNRFVLVLGAVRGNCVEVVLVPESEDDEPVA